MWWPVALGTTSLMSLLDLSELQWSMEASTLMLGHQSVAQLTRMYCIGMVLQNSIWACSFRE